VAHILSLPTAKFLLATALGISKMGISKMGISKMGISKMGISIFQNGILKIENHEHFEFIASYLVLLLGIYTTKAINLGCNHFKYRLCPYMKW
jgi:hypothetical protein